MLYDVQIHKLPGVFTDTVTSSRRYAVERAIVLNAMDFRGHRRVIVVDQLGYPVFNDPRVTGPFEHHALTWQERWLSPRR